MSTFWLHTREIKNLAKMSWRYVVTCLRNICYAIISEKMKTLSLDLCNQVYVPFRRYQVWQPEEVPFDARYQKRSVATLYGRQIILRLIPEYRSNSLRDPGKYAKIGHKTHFWQNEGPVVDAVV